MWTVVTFLPTLVYRRFMGLILSRCKPKYLDCGSLFTRPHVSFHRLDFIQTQAKCMWTVVPFLPTYICISSLHGLDFIQTHAKCADYSCPFYSPECSLLTRPWPACIIASWAQKISEEFAKILTTGPISTKNYTVLVLIVLYRSCKFHYYA